MTAAFVRRLKAPTPGGITGLPGCAVMQLRSIVVQQADQLADFLGGLCISGRQGLQPLNRPVSIAAARESRHRFQRLLLLHRIRADLQGSYFVHMLAAMIVVQDPHGSMQQGVDVVPDTSGPIVEHAQAHLVLRDQSG
jgi:hypothetical protein